MMGSEIRAVALAMVAAGYSVIPIAPNSKRPAIGVWRPYQQHIMSAQVAEDEFSKDVQLAIICGAVSGHLEVIDFDRPKSDGFEHWQQFVALCRDYGYEDLLRRLVIARTPSGGRHIFYRCAGYSQSNQKLAENANREVLIETRGEGGYVLAAPSKGYEWKQGSFATVPEVTPEEREFLLGCAIMLSEKVREVYQQERVTAPLMSGERPGDIYNQRASAAELLTSKGWQFQRDGGKRTYWVRPGKSTRNEPSGTLTNDHPPTFYCFSTNAAPLEADKGYSPFSLYIALEHGGDIKAAVKGAVDMFGLSRVAETPGKPKFEKPAYRAEPEFNGFDIVTPEELTDKSAEFGICGKLFLNGQFNLLEAEEGVGKTTFLLWVAANGSNGIDPIGMFGGMPPITKFKTILFAREDDASFYAKIYRKLGGQPGYLQIVTNGFELNTSVQAKLAKQIRASDAKLIAFDPMMSYIPQGLDMNSNGDMNRFFSGIRDIAMETNSCIVAVRHWTKPPGGKVAIKDIRFRGMGATAWRSTARSQISLAWHPDIKGMVLVMHTKGSIDSGQDSLFGFKRTPDGVNLYLPSSMEIRQLEVD